MQEIRELEVAICGLQQAVINGSVCRLVGLGSNPSSRRLIGLRVIRCLEYHGFVSYP